MPILALVLIVAWLVVVAGWRTWVQARRTGAVAVPAPAVSGSPAWWARTLSTIGFVLAVAAPLADLAGLPRFGILDQPAVVVAGLVLYGVGLAITVTSQIAMVDAWRGDVDPAVVTRLVTDGPFRVVRNPIMAGVVLTWLGIALLVPNVLSAAMLAFVIASLEIQVRRVEEPYLIATHGEAYRRYASRTGRFVPGLGRWAGDR
jgi:protein-S-isoprenylcysteine O-methyltransferase Ste14